MKSRSIILTSIDFQVGIIDCNDNHFVMFNGDTGEYTLVTSRDINKAPFKLLFIKSLGWCFGDMFLSLKILWPNRVVWRLQNPTDILKNR